MVVDQSDLPEASPDRMQAICNEGQLSRLRQLQHLPVKIVFRVPWRYLPKPSSNKQGWPLCFNVAMIAESEFVPTEQGLYFLDQPSHDDSDIKPDAVDSWYASYNSSQHTKPIRTRCLLGYYTGVSETGLARDLAQEPPGQLLRASLGRHLHINPATVGGFMMLINQMHGPARMLEADPNPPVPGDSRQLLLRTRRVDKLLSGPQEKGWAWDFPQLSSDKSELFRMAAAGMEMGWDYGACTDQQGDAMATLKCLCAACTGKLPDMKRIFEQYNQALPVPRNLVSTS